MKMVATEPRGTKRKRSHVKERTNGHGDKLDQFLSDLTSGSPRSPPRQSQHDRRGVISSKTSIAENGLSKSREPEQITSKSPSHHSRANGPTMQPAPRPSSFLAVKDLPIHSHRTSILEALSSHPVLILTGETGSGKSTQLPQYLLCPDHDCTTNPFLAQGQRVAVTQPRRVAAISLARRVASELSCPLGRAGKTAKVGYSVRFDRNIGHANQLIYLTEGMLLMEMLADPGLCGYGVVVLDEVHERSVDVDLLLGFLRELVAGRGKGANVRRQKGVASLRVVIMSATAEVEVLKEFFEESTGRQDSDGNNAAKKHSRHQSTETHSNGRSSGPQANNEVTIIKVEGRQYPVQVNYLNKPCEDFAQEALVKIFQVHRGEALPGDILVFMPGQESIQSLHKSVEEFATMLGPDYPKILVLPIYAALSQTAQQKVFDPAPPRTRKIILATNIAETSITVPGVRFVIDSGKEKRKQFRSSLGLESLLVKTISKSSAIQRQGRAGREAAGKCWRLYTEQSYKDLEENKAPEILRCDLASAVLKMVSSSVQDVVEFPFLTPPSRRALERALTHLIQLDALDVKGHVTPLGRQLSRFPLAPAYARVLVAAAEASHDTEGLKSIMLHVIDVVSCLTVDATIFLSTDTEAEREEAANARAALIRRQGDHVTLLAALQSYASEHGNRKAWADRHKVSHRAMQSVMDIRKQLRELCISQKLVEQDQLSKYDDDSSVRTTDEDTAERIMQCFLVGFKHNVALLAPDGTYQTLHGKHTVAIHPSSVLFGRKVEAVVYSEFVYTTKSYARNCGAVTMAWVDKVLDDSMAKVPG